MVIGTKLYNIHVDFRGNIIAMVYGIFAYLFRIIFTIFGLHTLFSVILLVMLVRIITGIYLSFSGIHTFVHIAYRSPAGLTVPVILWLVVFLHPCPWINIAVSIPIFLILVVIYYVLHRRGLYLYNLGDKGETNARDK